MRTAALLAVAVASAGCASGSTGDSAATVPSATQSTLAEDGGAPADTAGPAMAAQPFGDGVDELRDGIWRIADAGEVEFTLVDGALSLIEVRPAQGWQHRVSDDDDDEIEVRFTNGPVDWKLEVEIDDSTMEISKELKIRQADGGAYAVGSAAEVSFESDGSAVSLGEVSPSQGWEITEQEADSTDIEIEFRSDRGGKAEFEVESRDGLVEVEISQKLVGPIPS